MYRIRIGTAFLTVVIFGMALALKAQQVFPGGGTGSYNLTIPPDDYTGVNTFDVIGGGATGASWVAKGPGYTGPFQSHQWWTSALWHVNLGDGTDGEVSFRDNHSETMYPYPLVFTATSAGFVIQDNRNANNVSGANQVNNGPALTHMRVGFIGQNSPNTTVDGYGDYHATFRQTYSGDVLTATTASGCPYLFVTRQGNTDMNFYNQGTSRVNAIYTDANVNAISVTTNPGPSAGIIGIFFPPGTTLTSLGGPPMTGATIASLSGYVGGGDGSFSANFNADVPNASRYITVAVLPDASQATLNLFAQKAFNFITATTHTYSYSEANAMLTTNFSTTTNNVYGAANTGTLQALYRHQWLYSPQATGATNTGLTYPSPRGDMKLINSSTFQTLMPNLGILPNLGWANTGTKAMLNTYINAYVAGLGTMPTAADGYNKDAFSELTTNLQIAKQIGNNVAFNAILVELRSRLQDWLVSNDANFNRYFAYSPTFNHMSHYPNGFGSSGTFVDAHFHVGYIVNACAILARYDAAFVTNYGAMVETVIRSIDNDTKDMTDPGSNGTVKPWFPYLKYFDPYAGHSWADAKATNQESVSEALHFATGVMLWGEAYGAVTGNYATRDLGALLYITESEAARQYWFDVDNVVNGAPYANAYTHQHLTMLYNWGGNYATFFGTEPEYIHGITYLPVTGASTWLGTNSAAASTEYSQIGQNYAGWANWGQEINALQGTFNPGAAITAFNTNKGLWSPDKYAFTYHWDHTFDSVGVIDPTVRADITSFQVFKKGACKHYMIYMPPGKGPKVVTFTDGMVFNVPNDTVIVYKVCPALPVDWLSFSGKNIQNQYTQLLWSTAAEKANEYFEVQSSTDGVHWTKIGRVEGQVNSSTVSSYSFIDASPEYGLNYYRLKQVDVDGQYTYSKVISVYFGEHTTISLYPNPVTGSFTLQGSDVGESQIMVKDILGRTCAVSELSASVSERVYDSSGLSAGVYLVEILNVTTGEKLTVKMIKE